MGCSQVRQVQYFEVTGEPDPETGISTKTYYRMTIFGEGSFVEKYHMKAAYVSAATLDTLNGKIPTIPEADLSAENEAAFEDIRADYLGTLRQFSKSIRAQETVS